MLVTECVWRKSLCHRVKMCKVQMLRALVKQRLTAAAEEIFGLFERTIAEYEEELSRSKEENERQRKLLDAVFSPQLRLHRADVQQLLVVKEEVPPEQQDQEEPEPPHIKEEQEELCTSQEGEQLQGLEEADITAVPVKSEDDEEKAQSSQLHHRLTEQMETEADGEDCGGPEPARNSHTHTHLQLKTEDKTSQSTEVKSEDSRFLKATREDPDKHLQPDTEDKTEFSSDPETDDSADWKETREAQSGSNSLKNDEDPVSDSRCAGRKKFSSSECGKRFDHKARLKTHVKTHTGKKPYSCSVCKKSFTDSGNLQKHMRIHTGEKPFSCPECGKRFARMANMKIHVTSHTGEKTFSCSVCGQKFTWYNQLKRHRCAGCQSSQLHQTEENREAEPPASSSAEQMETEADGEDCGGPEPARNSHTHTHSQPDAEDKASQFIELKTEGSRIWEETRKPQPGSKSVKNDEVPVSDSRCRAGEKPFSCPECGKRFGFRGNVRRHRKTHTGEKPFSCSICGKSFIQKVNLTQHMRLHTGEKLYSCSVCHKRFFWHSQVKRHKCVSPKFSQLHQSH